MPIVRLRGCSSVVYRVRFAWPVSEPILRVREMGWMSIVPYLRLCAGNMNFVEGEILRGGGAVGDFR